MTTAPDPALRQPPTFSLDAPDDAAFVARAPEIEAYLLANFPGLRGLQQHRPHWHPEKGRTTDPLEHTLEVLERLDTSGLAPDAVRMLRLATIFHDLGKLLDPLNVRHATDSEMLAAPYLPDFGLSAAENAVVLAVVRLHDVLGRVCQGRLTVDEAMELFGTPQIADLTGRLTRADVGAIRGLAQVLPSIEAADRAVQALFIARQSGVRFRLPLTTTPEVAAVLGQLTPRLKLWVEVGEGQLALSEWRLRLLEVVQFTGSLAAAAERLNIPYRTARYKLHELEEHLGFPLLTGSSGGVSGGGSTLTPAAQELLIRWRAFSIGFDALAHARFATAFAPPEQSKEG